MTRTGRGGKLNELKVAVAGASHGADDTYDLRGDVALERGHGKGTSTASDSEPQRQRLISSVVPSIPTPEPPVPPLAAHFFRVEKFALTEKATSGNGIDGVAVTSGTNE